MSLQEKSGQPRVENAIFMGCGFSFPLFRPREAPGGIPPASLWVLGNIIAHFVALCNMQTDRILWWSKVSLLSFSLNMNFLRCIYVGKRTTRRENFLYFIVIPKIFLNSFYHFNTLPRKTSCPECKQIFLKKVIYFAKIQIYLMTSGDFCNII